MPTDDLLPPVGADHDRLRLDRYVRKARPDLSRGRIETLLRTGRVTVNGRPRAHSYFVKAGDLVRIETAPGEGSPPAGIVLLCASDHLLAIGKPPGMPTNPVRPHGASALAAARELWPQGPRPGILHRLDADTSGVILLARSPVGHRVVLDLFRERRIEKRYAAAALTPPPVDEGTIDLPLTATRSGKSAVSAEGKPALTRYAVRVRSVPALLDVRPVTGRTHQIRVHLARIGCPVMGDPLYGRPGGVAAPRLWLHCLSIELPDDAARLLGVPARIHCPLWQDLRAHLSSLGIEAPSDWTGENTVS